MRLIYLLALGLVTNLIALSAHAAQKPGANPQTEYEHEVNAIVRNKEYYKTGRLEITPLFGLMPYDSAVAHISGGGRLLWHISDHFGWEIIDAHMVFPTLTSYASNLASANGLPSIQLLKIKQIFTTNFVASPIYGKVRFFGNSVLHFDLYAVVGIGGINREIVRVGSTGTGVAATESSVSTGFDPLFNFGLGAKFFINHAVGLTLDLRDYVVYTNLYNQRYLRSNFAVFVGLSFYLPTF